MKNYLIEKDGVRHVSSSSKKVLDDVICLVPDSIDPGDYDYLVVTETVGELGQTVIELSVDTEAREADPDYEYKKKMRSK